MAIRLVLLLLNGVWLSARGRFYHAISDQTTRVDVFPGFLTAGLLMLVSGLVSLPVDILRA
jgi:hypothetical protein